MKFFITVALCIFLTDQLGWAQISAEQNQKKERHYVSVAFGVNANNYFGDLNAFEASNLFRTRRYRPGLNLSLEKKISQRTALAAILSWNRLTADDYYNSDPDTDIEKYTRNLSFRNDILEFSGMVKYYFKKNEMTYVERPEISPYVFLGLGVFFNNPKGRIPEFNLNGERFTDAGKWQSLRELGTEGQNSGAYGVDAYSLFQPVIPFGLGTELKVNSSFSINLELAYRLVFTDYLDDVSGNYVDLGALESDLAKVFSDRSREINSSNGRNPRNFEKIYQFTTEKTYQSEYDGFSYRVLEGYGEDGRKRGDDSEYDFYLSAGIRLIYILSSRKEKRLN